MYFTHVINASFKCCGELRDLCNLHMHLEDQC
jgi:hypothetical protein